MAIPLVSQRLVFRHDDRSLEPVADWSPAAVDLVKRRSAFFKPLILLLEDDPGRPRELIRFQNDPSDNDPTTLALCAAEVGLFLADEFQPFLNRVLASEEPLDGGSRFMYWVCKCAWICKCPPEEFLCPSEVLVPRWSWSGDTDNHLRGEGTAVARNPQNNTHAPIPLTNRPWDSRRECACLNDTCTCSLEFATICLWLGWKPDFKRHLRSAIWAVYVGSLDLETPVKKLRNLRRVREEARQLLRTDLEQYLRDHSKEWQNSVEKDTRSRLIKYLNKNEEVLPGRLGWALGEKLPILVTTDEVNDAPPLPPTPKTHRPSMKHDRRQSVTTTHTGGDSSLSSGGSGGGVTSPGPPSAKDSYDLGFVDGLWAREERKNISHQKKHNKFVNGLFEYLTSRIDERQDTLAEEIWRSREQEMRQWRWTLKGREPLEESNTVVNNTRQVRPRLDLTHRGQVGV